MSLWQNLPFYPKKMMRISPPWPIGISIPFFRFKIHRMTPSVSLHPPPAPQTFENTLVMIEGVAVAILVPWY